MSRQQTVSQPIHPVHNIHSQLKKRRDKKSPTVIGSAIVGIVAVAAGYYMSHKAPGVTLSCAAQEVLGGGESLKCGILTVVVQSYSVLYVLGVLSLIGCGLMLLGHGMEIFQGVTLAGYDKAIKEDPNNPENYIKRGGYYFKNKELRKALVDFNAALKLDPNNAPVTNNCGAAWQGLREYDKALSYYKQAIVLKPESELYRRNLSRLEAIIQRSSSTG